ncbi:MAG: Ppx/GppA family phosphatase [Rhodobiaceae bacterium]|nr:Ppx/GppA family phosphatase [Rhodobiaceae bacterium]MCC0018189.1 Ppx/GppA family phosphatase [Rhodobiaceae bacterium]MCC0041677.1 Ppx/GppA family phosphatase [Rhodobiaceae bacterium]
MARRAFHSPVVASPPRQAPRTGHFVVDGPETPSPGNPGASPQRKRRRRGRRGGRAWRRRQKNRPATAQADGASRQDAGCAAAPAKQAAGFANAGAPPAQARDGNGNSRAKPANGRPAAPAVRRNATPDTVYAALDLGTNNCRLLVARPTRNAFRVVDAFSRVVRLGQGLGATGELSAAAMDRAIDALAACRDKLVINGVNRHRLIATEACRQAANGADFLERVYRETGLALEVVSRETEAHLAVAGCSSLIDPEATGVVVFDIGGGSTELIVLNLENTQANGKQPGGDLKASVVGWTSLPVGVVGVAERHGGVDVSPETFDAMVSEVTGMLDAFPAVRALDRHPRANVHLLGTSGTVTTIAGVHLGLKRYDRRRVDGTWMGPHSIRAVNERLVTMSYDERAANACIGRDRADLVLAGCAIFEAIRLRWPWARVRVADRGLREGILMSLMSEDDAWREGAGGARSTPS